MKYYDEMGREITDTVHQLNSDNAVMKCEITQLKTLIVDNIVKEKKSLTRKVATLEKSKVKLEKENLRLRDKCATLNKQSSIVAKKHISEKDGLNEQILSLKHKLEEAQGVTLEFK